MAPSVLLWAHQRKVSFDRVMGWEMTLLEPRDYWDRVPPLWKPYWTFFNTPISSDPSHPDSPIRFIKSIGMWWVVGGT